MNFQVEDIPPTIFAELAEMPGNLEWFTEDGIGPVSVDDTPGCIYKGVRAEGTIGACAAIPINDVAMHIHLVFHPKHRRSTALAARELLLSVKATAHGMTLFSLTPADNAAALAMARLLGLKERGRLSGAHRRHRERHDMVILEVP